MQCGKHKNKFYASCFVKTKQPKRDPDNRTLVLMKKGNDGKQMPAGYEWVPRKNEVCYWSEESIDHAKIELLKVIKEKNFLVDKDRTERKETGVNLSVKKYTQHYKDLAKREAKRLEDIKKREAARKAHEEKVKKAQEESVE
jgi:hypothetical protein